MTSVLLMALLVVGCLAASAFWPATWALSFRRLFRNRPAARETFRSGGRWIAFSKSFGPRYALASIIASFVWLFVGMKLIPDTGIGAWVLFGPCLILIAVGVTLAALSIARWTIMSDAVALR
jgi:hypothetical protein